MMKKSEVNHISFALPDIGQEEIDEVIDCLESGWLTTGPKTAQFEEDFAEYVGVKHALAVNSATASAGRPCSCSTSPAQSRRNRSSG